MRSCSGCIGVISLVALGLATGWPAAARCDDDTAWREAYKLLQTGRYEEALAALKQLPAAEKAAQARRAYWAGRAYLELGKHAEALRAAERALQAAPTAQLAALKAEVLVAQGRYRAAAAFTAQINQRWPDDLQLNWIRYRALRAVGNYEEADRLLNEMFVLLSHEPPANAEQLLYAGHLMRAYAERRLRAEQQGELLNRVLNDYYDGAFQTDPLLWQARYASGVLFLAKHRRADAERDLRAALRVNPSATVVYVALGELALDDFKLDEALSEAKFALELAPHSADAHALVARIYLARAQLAEAVRAAERALSKNPHHWDALATLATARRLLGDPQALETAVQRVAAMNPRPAELHYRLGRALEDQRLFTEAERQLQRALEIDNAFNPPRAALGMLLMRIGREDRARVVLEEAFDRDPFSVRIKNTLEVLDVLEDYATFATSDLRIKVDPRHDAVLGYVAAWYLQEHVVPLLTRRFQYELPEPVLIEIFNRAKGHSGHEWFSARTIGLPWIGTVGACTGKVLAMVSPTALRKPFNWGRVLRHELTHAITLQQTNFNITHWFTEALAVSAEGFAVPTLWNEVLVDAHRRGDLLDLETINAAFIRPKNQARWALAYYQSKLYLEYMEQRFGADAAARLLAAYAAGHRDPRAVEEAFGVEVEDFEAGYRTFLNQRVEQIQTLRPHRPAPFAELEKRHATDPNDADVAAELALAYYERRGYRRARDLARSALQQHPNHPLALYVLARLYLKIGEDERAEELLRKAFNPDRPEPRVLLLLADRATRARRLDEARRLYELGRQRFPADTRWVAGLARVAILAREPAALAEALSELAHRDPTDLAVRERLAALAADAGNWQALEKWAWEVALVNPASERAYRWLEQAYRHLGRASEAARAAYAAGLADPRGRSDHWLRAAELYRDAGDRKQAVEILHELLQASPDHKAAAALLERLQAERNAN